MAQSEAQSTMEKLCSQSQKYSINSNDALVTLCGKAFETTAIVLSPASDKARMDLAITSLDNDRKLIFQSQKNGSDALRDLSFGLVETIQVLLEDKGKNIEEQNLSQVKLLESDGKLKRAVEMAGEYKARVQFLENKIDTKEDIIVNANGAESIDELKNKVAELTKQLEEERKGRMRDQERFKQDQPTIMREPPPSPTGSQLAIVDGCLGESISKKEEMDFDFEVNNDTLPIEQPLNEVPSNEEDSRAIIVPSDVVGEDMNSMDDPIIDDRNSTPIEKESLNDLLSSGDNVSKSAQTEMMDEANELMVDEKEKDMTVDHTTNIPKDSSETGELEKKKKRPSRTSSRHVNYTESLDESEPQLKKPKLNSDKKIDKKRGSDLAESSSKPPSIVVRVVKVNDTELECPCCEYRSWFVKGWMEHIYKVHSTSLLQLGLALLCECGHESFSFRHSDECEISKITVVRKNATPQCVMCEAHPTTALGYARHLQVHHKTNLKQKGIFLTCSCGYTVRSHNVDPEHTKKCNGHNYSLHKLDDE